MQRIKEKTNISDNVGDFLSSKIKRLPEDIQLVMKIAACLSTTLDWNRSFELHNGCLEAENSNTEIDLATILNGAKRGGLLERVEGNQWKFAHDRIQDYSIELVNMPGRRPCPTHLRIPRDALYCC